MAAGYGASRSALPGAAADVWRASWKGDVAAVKSYLGGGGDVDAADDKVGGGRSMHGGGADGKALPGGFREGLGRLHVHAQHPPPGIQPHAIIRVGV